MPDACPDKVGERSDIGVAKNIYLLFSNFLSSPSL